jgi:hypothetical protein
MNTSTLVARRRHTGAARVRPRDGPSGRLRSVAVGAVAAASMALFYVAVVRGASGSWEHLADQVRADWYLLVIVVTGFGAQVGMLSELRRRQRLTAVDAAAGGAGAGAATAGMIACCAHHLADLLPFVGLAGLATFLYDYRLAFVGVGIAINAIAIVLILRRLRAIARHETTVRAGEASCAA